VHSNLATSSTLLRRLQLGPQDSSAWADFARRYGPGIHQWCKNWGLDDADAEEFAERVLTQLLERLRRFEYDGKGSFRTWLKNVTLAAWAKLIAEKKPGHGANKTARLESPQARDDLVARLDAEFDQEVLGLAMLRVSQKVDFNTWEAFRLLALAGRPGWEVARQLEMKVAAVYLARSKVQKLLRQECAVLEKEGAKK